MITILALTALPLLTVALAITAAPTHRGSVVLAGGASTGVGLLLVATEAGHRLDPAAWAVACSITLLLLASLARRRSSERVETPWHLR